MEEKKKSIALLLAFFFGFWGIHRFYLGQNGLGILYIILSFMGISFFIWPIEFLVFLVMSQERFDRRFNPGLYRERLSQHIYHSQNAAHRQRHHSHQQRPQQHTSHPQRYPNQAPQQRSPQPPQRRKHDRNADYLQKAQQLRNEINKKIEDSDRFDTFIVQDLKPLVNKYVEQIKELVERDKKIERVLQNSSIDKIDSAISELNRRLQSTQNPELKREYEKSIAKYFKHKKSLQEFAEQREMINLRLESTVMSLSEIKFDLLKMETITSEQEGRNLYKQFEEKTQDLTNYLSALRNDYDYNDMEIDTELDKD